MSMSMSKIFGGYSIVAKHETSSHVLKFSSITQSWQTVVGINTICALAAN